MKRVPGAKGSGKSSVEGDEEPMEEFQGRGHSLGHCGF